MTTEKNVMNRSPLREVLLKNDCETLRTFSARELLSFKDEGYTNVFLFSIRECTVTTVRMVVDIIKNDPKIEKIEYDALFSSRDSLDRGALAIATIADSAELIHYLTSTLRYTINYRDKRNDSALTTAIFRNSKKAFEYLILNGGEFTIHEANAIAVNPELSKMLAKHANVLIQKTKVSKKKMGNALTHSPEKVKQAGRIPKTIRTDIPRPYRSFSKERERQLLRQVATQLYFGFDKKRKAELKEIQIMHIEFSGAHHLFIAVNEHSLSENFSGYVRDMKNLKEILTTAHEGNDNEGSLRSKRYAGKLNQRVFNQGPIKESGCQTDMLQAKHVARLLNQGELFFFPLELDSNNQLVSNTQNELRHTFLKTKDRIHFIVIRRCSNKLRHAEEFLADVAEYALRLSVELQLPKPYTCVGGKKRPCMGCSGRMKNVITQFGQNPGRYWVNTLENQSNAAAINTVALLLTSPSHVTRCQRGDKLARDYDSGSDSEPDARVSFKKL